MNRKFALAVSLVVATICSGFGHAFGDDVSNTTAPFSGTIFDECSGEVIDYSGTTHQVVTSTVDSTGVEHFTDHVDIAETAIGETSGNSYIGRGEDEFSVSQSPTELFTTTEPVNVELIGQGNVPNLLIKNLFHITTNQDDTGFVSFVFDAEVVCQ